MKKRKKGSSILLVLAFTMIVIILCSVVTGAVMYTTKENSNMKVYEDLLYAAESGIEVAVNKIIKAEDPISPIPLPDTDGNPLNKKYDFEINKDEFKSNNISILVKIEKDKPTNGKYYVISKSKNENGKTKEVKAVVGQQINNNELFNNVICGNTTSVNPSGALHVGIGPMNSAVSGNFIDLNGDNKINTEDMNISSIDGADITYDRFPFKDRDYDGHISLAEFGVISDKNGDGIIDYKDLNIEDENGDGVIDFIDLGFVDKDGDGLLDVSLNDENINEVIIKDFNGDGFVDIRDMGIVDKNRDGKVDLRDMNYNLDIEINGITNVGFTLPNYTFDHINKINITSSSMIDALAQLEMRPQVKKIEVYDKFGTSESNKYPVYLINADELNVTINSNVNHSRFIMISSGNIAINTGVGASNLTNSSIIANNVDFGDGGSMTINIPPFGNPHSVLGVDSINKINEQIANYSSNWHLSGGGNVGGGSANNYWTTIEYQY